MALECILILVMTVELILIILSVIEGSREYSEWSGEMAGPATAMFTFAETSRQSTGKSHNPPKKIFFKPLGAMERRVLR